MRCESPNHMNSNPTSSATRMQASMWEKGKWPGRSMTPNLIILASGEVAPAGAVRDDLSRVVGDPAPRDGRGRPAPRHVSLVRAEVDRGVERGEIHLDLAIGVDDDEVGVRPRLERAPPPIEH